MNNESIFKDDIQHKYYLMLASQKILNETNDQDVSDFLVSKMKQYNYEISVGNNREYIEKVKKLTASNELNYDLYTTSDEKRAKLKTKNKKIIKMFGLLAVVVALVFLGLFVWKKIDSKYENAVAIVNSDPEKAYQLFSKIPDYRQSNDYLEILDIINQLKEIESGEKDTDIFVIRKKLNRLEELNQLQLGVEYDLSDLENKTRKKEDSILNTYWEGESWTDSISKKSFKNGAFIDSEGNVYASKVSFYADENITEANWTNKDYFTKYKLVYLDGYYCATENDNIEIKIISDDVMEYSPYALIHGESYKLKRISSR